MSPTPAATSSWPAESLRDAEPRVFWTDTPDAPAPRPALTADTTADLLVAVGASGRNGGFCAASLTHGLDHGAASWPGEIDRLVTLGRANLAAIAATVAEHGIDADYEPAGQLAVAVKDNHVERVRHSYELHRVHGEDVEWLEREALQARVSSPTYLRGFLDRGACAIVHPAKLVWGLGALAERLGVRIYEHTEMTGLDGLGDRMRVPVRTARGTTTVTARDVLLATNAYPSPLRRLRAFILPVYDHVLMTEPLSPAQTAALGWAGREGIGDGGHQFHYYRRTADNRILWGGYDANYHRGGAVDVALEQRAASHRLLAGHFFATFPQLEGLRFSHRWGGAIDTTSRFTPMFGTAYGGRVAYAVGYTGLGVGSSRWAAQVALDLLAGRRTELTQLEMVRRLPVPFPPEPLRYPIVSYTRGEIARSDETGRRGPWLALLDRFGVGFDS